MAGRIVVGIDGSEHSRDALAWAAAQAKRTGSSLSVILAWHFPVSTGWNPPYPTDFDPAEDATRLLRDEVDEVLGEHPDVVVNSSVVEGPAAQVLVEEALTADLLVLGSRGHGAFVGMLLGSVSHHLASHSPCPLVIVRGEKS
jgi:nucleotide-binding universal stress UspA family protein